ncbi:sensor histidine kinase [Mucilaginibacter arboris]|uniref:histidine kinase n=1 Tax=Mucilaginibacter arboris TaxID=2682090 RepID=A0A7K1T0T2_9SPHI|nr:HAMP domain-containing sensor histidine kinase [Mucilaginibacter arboris]MVN23174.1 GHKL domain-containing protein [Mucilaginibacter arboris]
MNLFLRIVSFFYQKDLSAFKYYQEHNFVNWMHLLVLPLFLFLDRLLLMAYQHKTKITIYVTRIFTIAFGSYLVISGMLTSFMAMHNPHNTLTFFMVALIITAGTLVFEVPEVIIIIAVIEAVFYALLKFNIANNTDFIYNILASIVLSTGFYMVSRYLYTYKFKNFLQLIQIEQNNIELQKASNFKNEVLGMVAHDLRNPIAAIESIASLMEMDELDKETGENVTMIKASCVKAREIVNELLEAARDESDLELVTTVVNVNELLVSLVNEWKNQNVGNEIVFVSADKNSYSNINTEKFHRVLDNLITNAVKFSEPEGKIEVRLTEVKQDVCIEVKDYGIGIPQHLLPYIFDRFTKSSRKGLRGEKSTGLGLNIARRIVEKHGGTMEAESIENEGSIFRICLPKADASFTA